MPSTTIPVANLKPAFHPQATSSHQGSTDSGHSSTKAQIIAALDIPLSLTSRPKAVHLRLAYAKYKGYLKAQADMHRMMKEGVWTFKTLTADELVEIFVSRSVWHASYRKLFPKVQSYPALLQWLENTSDGPSNVEVFGVEKQSYTFKDLQNFFDASEVIPDVVKKDKKRPRTSAGQEQKNEKKGKKRMEKSSKRKQHQV